MFKVIIIALSLNGNIVGWGISNNEYAKEECGQHILEAMQGVVAEARAKGKSVFPSGGCMPSAEADALFKKMDEAHGYHDDDSI